MNPACHPQNGNPYATKFKHSHPTRVVRRRYSIDEQYPVFYDLPIGIPDFYWRRLNERCHGECADGWRLSDGFETLIHNYDTVVALLSPCTTQSERIEVGYRLAPYDRLQDSLVRFLVDAAVRERVGSERDAEEIWETIYFLGFLGSVRLDQREDYSLARNLYRRCIDLASKQRLFAIHLAVWDRHDDPLNREIANRVEARFIELMNNHLAPLMVRAESSRPKSGTEWHATVNSQIRNRIQKENDHARR